MLWLSSQSSTTTNIRWWSDDQIIRRLSQNLGFWCLQIIRSKYLPLDQHWERGVASVVDFSSVLYTFCDFVLYSSVLVLPVLYLLWLCFYSSVLRSCSHITSAKIRGPAWQCPMYIIHWKQYNSFFWSFMICGGLVNHRSNIWWWPTHQKLCRQRGMVGEMVSDGLEQSKAFERILRLNKCISKSLVL